MRPTATAADNMPANILHLVTEAQEEKKLAERSMNPLRSPLRPAVLLTGIAIAVNGALGEDWSTWVERAAAVVVAAAPAASAG